MRDFKQLKKDTTLNVGIAIFLCLRNDGSHFHTGFLVRSDSGTTEQVHLEFHLKLKRETLDYQHEYIWAELGFASDIQTQVLLIGRLQQILSQKNWVPFGLNHEGTGFDGVGKFRHGESGTGLTCSTFVLQVCKELGFTLLLENTWPLNEPKDIEWQTKIIGVMSQQKDALPIYVAAAEKFIGFKRYRPAQVAVAAAAPIDQIPLDHKAAIAKAAAIVKSAFGKKAAVNC